MQVGKLVLGSREHENGSAHTGCSTQKSRPCILPGQHSKADPIIGDTGKLAPRTLTEKT